MTYSLVSLPVIVLGKVTYIDVLYTDCKNSILLNQNIPNTISIWNVIGSQCWKNSPLPAHRGQKSPFHLNAWINSEHLITLGFLPLIISQAFLSLWAFYKLSWAFLPRAPVDFWAFCVCTSWDLSTGSGQKGEFCLRPKIASQTPRRMLLKFSAWVPPLLCFTVSSS